ncbi:MAG: hypothetical protein ABI670_19430 [Chloroflexota bacterium]
MTAEIRVLGGAAASLNSDEHENAPIKNEQESPPIDDRPRSVYEIVTRQMLEELKVDVGEVKGRVNTLLWLVAGGVVLDMVLRLVR